jgi:hypothetical protein
VLGHDTPVKTELSEPGFGVFTINQCVPSQRSANDLMTEPVE